MSAIHDLSWTVSTVLGSSISLQVMPVAVSAYHGLEPPDAARRTTCQARAVLAPQVRPPISRLAAPGHDARENRVHHRPRNRARRHPGDRVHVDFVHGGRAFIQTESARHSTRKLRYISAPDFAVNSLPSLGRLDFPRATASAFHQADFPN